MKLPLYIQLILLVLVWTGDLHGQARKTALDRSRPPAAHQLEAGQQAVVIDETLSVLRLRPTLFSESVQRMRRGRRVKILGVAEADGVKFFKVTAPPSSTGWVQADAVFGKFREGDEQRLANLVQASSGFNQIEIAIEFFNLFPSSALRAPLMLMFGDLLEETAARLSREAGSRLNRREMAAIGAPLHSFYLNYVSLDRYRKLGVHFQFNSSTRQFHYDGSRWKEILANFPAAPEAAEARKRLDELRVKLTPNSAVK